MSACHSSPSRHRRLRRFSSSDSANPGISNLSPKKRSQGEGVEIFLTSSPPSAQAGRKYNPGLDHAVRITMGNGGTPSPVLWAFPLSCHLMCLCFLHGGGWAGAPGGTARKKAVRSAKVAQQQTLLTFGINEKARGTFSINALRVFLFTQVSKTGIYYKRGGMSISIKRLIRMGGHSGPSNLPVPAMDFHQAAMYKTQGL
jgi:hypothetical protein